MSADSDGYDVNDERWGRFCDDLLTQAKFGLDLGLAPIRQAFAVENHPERSAPAILVAGTNGKGGTAAYIAGLLQAHGLRVGLFTSPHMMDLTERFRLDGLPMDREHVMTVGRSILDRHAGDDPKNGEGLTFFELTTLIAASLFDEADVDVAIYEVGLGGRLDAVNAIEPTVSVLTSIDLDHTEYLGDTLSEITREKCGITRPGRPLVIGYQRHEEVYSTIREETCSEQIYCFGDDFDASPVVAAISHKTAWTKVVNAAAGYRLAQVFLDSESVSELAFSDEKARDGLRRTRWPGRFDWRSLSPTLTNASQSVRVLFDCAHNPGAVESLFEQLEGWPDAFSAVVCGGMADKELTTMFARLTKGPPAWGVTLSEERAAGADELRAAMPEGQPAGIGDVSAALTAAAKRAADENGAVLVFGSVYLVGAAFEFLGFGPDELSTYQPKTSLSE